VVLPSIEPAPKAALYATAVGEHRHVVLADGSTIDLNGGTRLSVVLRRHERDVALDEGQAVFAVAHDARRPFQVAAGDRIIRDVGTEFDVRRRARLLTVTVASGAVEVSPLGAASGEAFRLHPGQQLIHEEGSAVARLQTAEPDQALGWRTGKLVYRSQPLAQVVADLNAQFKTPIRIADPALAATPISGVLILDNEDAVVRRLALLVSAKPVVSDGSVTLQRFGAAGR
jgi:transmembrane sensor